MQRTHHPLHAARSQCRHRLVHIKTLSDSQTEGAKGLGKNVINNNQPESDYEQESDFNTPELRNDLAAM